MLRIVWDACSTVCRTASAKLSGDRPDSSMNFTTDIVPSLIVRAGYGLPETAGMQLGAGCGTPPPSHRVGRVQKKKGEPLCSSSDTAKGHWTVIPDQPTFVVQPSDTPISRFALRILVEGEGLQPTPTPIGTAVWVCGHLALTAK